MEYRLLAKLFNSSELKKVSNGDLGIFDKFESLAFNTNTFSSLAEFYDEVYKLLLRYYRNEYVVKNEVTNKVLLGRHSMKTTVMMSELRTGKNIADCVVLNGHSTCYEIKTEFDSLTRLQEQLHSYLKAYEKTYVIAHASHIKDLLHLHKRNPAFGVFELTKRNSLKKIVDAPTSKDFDFDITFETLRKSEYLHIAKSIRGEIPEMPNSKIYGYCKDLYNSISPENANHLFKESLKLFRSNDQNFINALPKSLKNIGISYQFSKQEKNNLLYSLMDNPKVY
jgi:hypothetical protein